MCLSQYSFPCRKRPYDWRVAVIAVHGMSVASHRKRTKVKEKWNGGAQNLHTTPHLTI